MCCNVNQKRKYLAFVYKNINITCNDKTANDYTVFNISELCLLSKRIKLEIIKNFKNIIHAVFCAKWFLLLEKKQKRKTEITTLQFEFSYKDFKYHKKMQFINSNNEKKFKRKMDNCSHSKIDKLCNHKTQSFQKFGRI